MRRRREKISHIAVITPIDHLHGVREVLEGAGSVKVFPDNEPSSLLQGLRNARAIFTNPNRANIYLGDEIFHRAPRLEVVCTASTGTNHIDTVAAAARNIQVLSLRDMPGVIADISSTAEHALALTLAAVRGLPFAHNSALAGDWDYLPFVGRQMSNLVVGVVGLGRLGAMYASYMKPLAKDVFFFDPNKHGSTHATKVPSLTSLFNQCDIISLHLHVEPATTKLVSHELLTVAKPSLVLVNTSRGEIVDENAVCAFLRHNPASKYATDVLTAETFAREESPVLQFSRLSRQVIITPHIGGMTLEAQNKAYMAAATSLAHYLNEKKARPDPEATS